MFFSLWAAEDPRSTPGDLCSLGLWLVAGPIFEMLATHHRLALARALEDGRTVLPGPGPILVAGRMRPRATISVFMGATGSISLLLIARDGLRASVGLHSRSGQEGAGERSRVGARQHLANLARECSLADSVARRQSGDLARMASQPARRVGGSLIMGFTSAFRVIFSVLAIFWPTGNSGALVNGFQVAIGLLCSECGGGDVAGRGAGTRQPRPALVHAAFDLADRAGQMAGRLSSWCRCWRSCRAW